MVTGQAGKGSKPRDLQGFREGWARIFGDPSTRLEDEDAKATEGSQAGESSDDTAAKEALPRPARKNRKTPRPLPS